MACGAPVVASATGGILEVVVPEGKSEPQTGHLVPFDADPVTTFPSDSAKFSQDLATNIKDLLVNPDKAKSLGKAGRKRVEDHFSWTSIATQTIDLYKSLIAMGTSGKASE